MTGSRRTRSAGKSVEALRHEQDSRPNIPTAEYQSMLKDEQASPIRAAYERRNRDLDPQLVWRGKSQQTRTAPSSKSRPSTSRKRDLTRRASLSTSPTP